MTAVCPAGHSSEAEDYCDVCGMPIDALTRGRTRSPPAPTDLPAESPAATPTGQPCPNCGTENASEALFCEVCGYDFTTGSMPRQAGEHPSPAAPAAEADDGGHTRRPRPRRVRLASPTNGGGAAAVDWVAEVWIDPAWYEAQDSPDPLPSPGLPDVVPLRSTSVLVGRKSASRNINPEIDCGNDSGVSRRQAQMTTDGRRWFVEDLESANGTFVGPASGALPTDPIAVGTKHELDADDRVYVGAWTRLVIREATEDETGLAGLAAPFELAGAATAATVASSSASRDDAHRKSLLDEQLSGRRRLGPAGFHDQYAVRDAASPTPRRRRGAAGPIRRDPRRAHDAARTAGPPAASGPRRRSGRTAR